jgi:hypothetical protein
VTGEHGGPTTGSATFEVERLRHPRERAVFAASVVVNVAFVVGAITIVSLAPDWLSSHDRVSHFVERLRFFAIALIVLLPLLGILRLGRWAALREDSVQLGRDQMPEIFAILERHCETLGMELPELYISGNESVGMSTALAVGDHRVIVLGPKLFEGLERLRDRVDVLSFALAYELGRLTLGHATWWADILLAYLKRVPVLRRPLLTVQTYSRDRFALALSPGGIRGLVLDAVGGDILDHVDLATLGRQVTDDDTPRRWRYVGMFGRDRPYLSDRVRELQHAGLLDAQRDVPARERLSDAPHEAPPGAGDAGASRSPVRRV